ncbi:MAG: trypsin-like peptidase domain-containing protein [Patescibacteria group bacterium]|jgi:serine protease Do
MPVSTNKNGFLQEEPPIIKKEKKSSQPKMVTVPLGRFMVMIVVVSILVGGLSGAIFASSGAFDNLTNSLKNTFAVQRSAELVNTQTLSVEEESKTTDVVNTSNDSVVSIIVTKDLSELYNSSGNPFYDFYYQYNTNQENGQQEIGGGSGFIISEDGLIVTNKHVVSDADAEYTVLLNNRETYSAKVVATDPLNDIAFVKIEATSTLKPLEFGDSESLQIGETVIAIGNALGEYRNTVTKGIVSGLARTVVASDGQGSSETLDNVIQTDAAINPGNSGGPLLNLAGQVIGINTAISEEGQLIGFAIPVNEIKKAVDSVKETGRVVRPMLGVRYMSVTADVAKQYDLTVEYGALVVEGSNSTELAVVTDSAADRAGLKKGDVILKINDDKIEGDITLSQLVQKYAPGDEVTITYMRDGSEQTVKVKLDEHPDS